jgi:SAM-dependent methyltransferase
MDFKSGEMEELPYAEHIFDLVTGLNSFQFASNIVNALKEACRVTKSGGKVVMLVWGKPEDCEASSFMKTISSFMPPPPPPANASKRPPLFSDGAVENLAREAGLVPEHNEDVDCMWEFRDKDEALRCMLSAGLSVLAMQNAGEEKVRTAAAEIIEQYRKPDGKYRIKNRFRYVISRA